MLYMKMTELHMLTEGISEECGVHDPCVYSAPSLQRHQLGDVLCCSEGVVVGREQYPSACYTIVIFETLSSATISKLSFRKIRVSNSLNPDETQRYMASHLDPNGWSLKIAN